MKAILVAQCLAALTVTWVSPSQAQAPRAHFQLVVESSDSSFIMRCLSGCRWRESRFSCALGCQVVVDAYGVTEGVATRQNDAPFAFRFHRTKDGWAAESLGGTAWRDLSSGCTPGPCRDRVDQQGVQGLRTDRGN